MSELSDLDLGFKSLKYGDIVAGTIVRVDPREILVDIGSKSEGIVDQEEMEGLSPEAVKKLQVFADGDLRNAEMPGQIFDQHAAIPVQHPQDFTSAFFIE